MTYSEIVNWMFGKLPMYQKQGASAYKKDLSNTIKLAEHLGHPETKFKSVHVGGTNGKGSTSHLLASVFQEAGYKVGLYTSPHLKDYRERIQINGKKIPKAYITDFINSNHSFFESESLSFFEMTVGLAFKYFSDEKVDIAIIEVGMGGRLDSTNIITPEISIITNIGFDHMQFLGDTLEKIAFEKAGIIKQNIPIVIGETNSHTELVFRQKAEDMSATIIFADQQLEILDVPSSLKGNYQVKNRKTVLVALEILSKMFARINQEAIINGFKNVIDNTNFMGRWQILNDKPRIIVDTAHNKDGLTEVLGQLEHEMYSKLHMVIGFVNDKEVDDLLAMFPKQAKFYFCAAKISRALDVKTLLEKAANQGLMGDGYNSVKDALQAAKECAKESDLIFVGGSTFVVSEVV